jgi:hypothetical protein
LLSYGIDEDRGIVEVKGDETSPDDFDTLLAEVLTDTRFRLGFGFLRDRRGTDPPTMGMVRRRVTLVRHLRAIAQSRWAIVLTADQLRQYAPAGVGPGLAADGAAVALFTDLDAARAWLGRPREAGPPLLND